MLNNNVFLLLEFLGQNPQLWAFPQTKLGHVHPDPVVEQAGRAVMCMAMLEGCRKRFRAAFEGLQKCWGFTERGTMARGRGSDSCLAGL